MRLDTRLHVLGRRQQHSHRLAFVAAIIKRVL
jgi:hypothetical protein